MFKKVYFYVGSNNDTHELETVKIESIVSKYFQGFTAFEVIGYWKGNKERTYKIEVVTEENITILSRIAKELKEELKQESVLMEVVNSNCLFI